MLLARTALPRVLSRSCIVNSRRLLSTPPGNAEHAFRVHVGASWAGKPGWMTSPSKRSRDVPHPETSPIGVFRDQTLARPKSFASTEAGEDFLYVTQMRNNSGISFGLADGVGGWSESGYDPSLFSQSLMYHASEFASNNWAGEPETDPALEHDQPRAVEGSEVTPLQCLEHAYKETLREPMVLAGSSTACIINVSASSGLMKAVNLGDSGFCILRSSQIVHWQPPQTHFFNCPRQLAKMPSGGRQVKGRIDDKPKEGDQFQTLLRDGDIVVVFSDGLSDNVFPSELARIIQLATRTGSEGQQVQVAADRLVEFSRECMFKHKRVSPFQVEAARHRDNYAGGKPDDVTVLVAMVRETI